jgi:hypothetical protein
MPASAVSKDLGGTVCLKFLALVVTQPGTVFVNPQTSFATAECAKKINPTLLIFTLPA